MALVRGTHTRSVLSELIGRLSLWNPLLFVCRCGGALISGNWVVTAGMLIQLVSADMSHDTCRLDLK